ncbi:MAG: helix-turn-helix domain-containing protein [Alphaproteobacteria bacterium]
MAAKLNVQFIAGPDGRPAFAVLPVEDYYRLLDGAIGAPASAPAPRSAWAPSEPPPPPSGYGAEFEMRPPPPRPPRPPTPETVSVRVEAGENPILVWREERGLTREALAGFIGFQEDDIEAFETGEITPSVEICQMLAMALDVDFEDVIPI